VVQLFELQGFKPVKAIAGVGRVEAQFAGKACF